MDTFLIPKLEPHSLNEATAKDLFSFVKQITKYHSSLFMASLIVESLFTNILLNETINNCVSDLHKKIFITENSAKEIFSNF